MTPPTSPEFTPASSSSPLTLLAEFEVRSDHVDRDQWLEVWGRRAHDAWEHESETPAYGAAICTDHENRVLIFERYHHGDESLARHMSRDAHTALMKEMTTRNMTKRRLSLAWLRETQGWGRWAPLINDRNMANLSVHITGIRFGNSRAKAAFIERSTPVAASIAARDDNIKILGLGEALKPNHRHAELDTGDLAVVTVNATQTLQVTSTITQMAENAAISYERDYRTVNAGYFWR